MGCGQRDGIVYLDPARRVRGREESAVALRAHPDTLVARALRSSSPRWPREAGALRPGHPARNPEMFSLGLGRPLQPAGGSVPPTGGSATGFQTLLDPTGPRPLLLPELRSRWALIFRPRSSGGVCCPPPLPQPRQGKSLWGGKMIIGSVFAGSLLTS